MFPFGGVSPTQSLRAIPTTMTGRRFLLSDAIVLDAAKAGGLAVVRPYHATMKFLDWSPPISSAAPFNGWIKGLWGCLVLAAPLVMAWTLAILVLRFRRPWPRWVRVVRQPGFVACLMSALALAWRLLGFATLYVRVHNDPGLAAWLPRHFEGSGCFMGGNPGWLLFDTDHFLNTMAMIGAAVASSWILLLVTGQWRPEQSCIDCAGRVLGWFWITILPLTSWWDFHS
jgi:hypothetical protein